MRHGLEITLVWSDPARRMPGCARPGGSVVDVLISWQKLCHQDDGESALQEVAGRCATDNAGAQDHNRPLRKGHWRWVVDTTAVTHGGGV